MNASLVHKRICPLSAVAGVAWLLAGVGVLGCESFGGNRQPTGGAGPAASPMQHPALENIPLPLGFQIVPERSVATSSGQVRVAKFEFQGGSPVDDVVTFYAKYMPSAKFVLREKDFDNGGYVLRFENDTEVCNVRVRSVKSKTVLVLEIRPLPKGSTEREAKPAVRQP